ncbi:response regulator transcription factor [Paenibacillus tundrae]|uniref:YesN/AraC family two-component response regulator n=1 Tax=Paenibacillus tundrae TaxID=528187 RepID=A0ABT9W7P0_9BACL|nr:helix-turn-helix domain-containing protein [Paenibacillus tundrae]MDQ0169269.1 YesN/AraC family two-component response regulator [Paenibacillus tundrae]
MWKVLLVEDEVFVRESVREIISWEELGFTVIGESGNGTEALAMIIQDVPDLVLTDIVMPGMDGLELLKQTRQAGLKTKFVMLTCMGEFEYVRRAMEYGASNYILKLSMSVNSLRDTLRKVSAELGDSAEVPTKANHHEVSPPATVLTPTPASPSLTTSHAALTETDLPFTPVREPMVKHPEISKIIEYIGQHYDQDITVKSMSRFVMMGENYVSALFKKKTGHTLIHYLHGVRMEKATEYLRETNLPVQEISYRVGFGSDNYFIKIFKRWTGCTPSQYRHRS